MESPLKRNSVKKSICFFKTNPIFAPEPDFPLVHTDRPANYDRKIIERKQPSVFYKPVYNISTNLRLSGDNPNPYEKDEEVDNTSEKLPISIKEIEAERLFG